MLANVNHRYGKGFLVAAAIGPAFFYPCLYLVLLSIDTLLGDRVIIDHLLFVSKRDIWNLFWGDWAAALLPGYLLAVPAIALSAYVAAVRNVDLRFALPGVALLEAAVITVFVFGGHHAGTIVATALLFAVPAGLILSKCSQ